MQRAQVMLPLKVVESRNACIGVFVNPLPKLTLFPRAILTPVVQRHCRKRSEIRDGV